MRFVCSNSESDVFDCAAEVIGIKRPELHQFIELGDDRLITIAKALGMEELSPAISNEEAMRRLGIEVMGTVGRIDKTTGEPPIEVLTVGDKNPWLLSTSEMPACEICGKPVKSKRAKTCSDECTREKQRRYARDYYHRKEKSTEDAGGPLPPLPPEGEETFSIREWGSDPGDEPVRAAGL